MVISFSLLIVFFSALNLFASFYLELTTVDDFAEKTLTQSTQYASKEYEYFMESVQNSFNFSISRFSLGSLDINNTVELNKYFKALVKNIPQITSINIATPNGQGYLFLIAGDGYKNRLISPEPDLDILWRELDSELVVTKEYAGYSNYDSRLRPWYNIPRDFENNSWTQPYTFQTTKDAGITISRMVKLPDGNEMVLAFDVLLKDLTKVSQNTKPTPNTKALIVLENGRIIGLPNYDKFLNPDVQNNYILRHFSFLDIPELNDVLSQWKQRRGTNELKGKIDTVNGKYWYGFVKLSNIGPFRAWMVIYIPREDLVSDLNTHLITLILISIISVIFAVIFAVFLSRYFTKPMKDLLKFGNTLASLDSSKQQTSQPLISELSELTNLSDDLRITLDSFSKYMPKEIARQLIKDDKIARLTAQKENVAMLFTEVHKFSKFLEKTSTAEMLQQLEEYFNVLFSGIMDTQGVLDKCMNSSVLSFWGPPYNLENPSLNAVQAVWKAYEGLEALNEKWSKQGKTPFYTQFGLLYGDTLVGSFGASFRMHYSALGPLVSCTNIIQQANKIYGTSILVSEGIKSKTETDFHYRLIDRVGLKQSATTLKLYELLGPKGAVLDPILLLAHQYEIALEQYFIGEYSKCSDILDAVESSFPHDKPLSRLNKLAKKYAKNPPKDGSEIILL